MKGTLVELDARGLEPPQPLIRILSALGELPDGGEIHARTDRRPIHLYPLLLVRGYRGETTHREGEGFLTIIRRRD
jgi:hypothetical protein